MKIAVLGYGNSDGTKVQEIKANPNFRKASQNMVDAYEAIQYAVKDVSVPSEAAMIVGSSYGELENTKDFLKTFKNMGLARPLLFQSSLHNGTLGFLALELKIKGPSFTISQSHLTAEKSLELAIDLLRAEVCEICLVVTVDRMSAELLPALEKETGLVGGWYDQASAIVLSSENYALKNKLEPKAFLDSVEFKSNQTKLPRVKFNHSDGLRCLNESFGNRHTKELILPKLDHTVSVLKWSD